MAIKKEDVAAIAATVFGICALWVLVASRSNMPLKICAFFASMAFASFAVALSFGVSSRRPDLQQSADEIQMIALTIFLTVFAMIIIG